MAGTRDAAGAALPDTRKGQPAVASPDETMFPAVAEDAFRRHARRWKPPALKVDRSFPSNQILPRFKGRQVAGISRKDVQDL